MISGEMGAEVIKVEHPVGGDPGRAIGPPKEEIEELQRERVI
jgi:crotonobetainyl-CoA:carnitine CoA-transferase CaiB-like acyl-CoA transferase